MTYSNAGVRSKGIDEYGFGSFDGAVHTSRPELKKLHAINLDYSLVLPQSGSASTATIGLIAICYTCIPVSRNLSLRGIKCFS